MKNFFALALGVVTTSPNPALVKTKVDRLLSDTPGSRLVNDAAFFQPGSGKLTFRSHLSEAERTAVKKVANGSYFVFEIKFPIWAGEIIKNPGFMELVKIGIT